MDRFKKVRKKNKLNRRKFFTILTVLLLGVIAVSVAVTNNYNETVKSTSNAIAGKNDNEAKAPDENAESSEKVQEGNEERFNGVPTINNNRGVPVLCYHSVVEDQSKKGPIAIPKQKFKEQLQAINDNGYTTLTMAELNDYLFKDEPIPEKSVLITFDDGYMDNYTIAFPILKEFNMKATIFVIPSYLNVDYYLTGDKVKEMSDYGIDIQSHTYSHNRLSTMSYEEQLNEVKTSKTFLENLTHKPIIAIAYPEGMYNDDTKKVIVDAGYSMGFTIERGYSDRDDNQAQLNRICVDYTYKAKDILKVLTKLKK